ncbi:MAG: hypothetical protein EOP23_03805 [Hyphomicrobiales bacterium]|nr:MAG: hypothetical protein EOP23_03805 [Hyphomicrobiales bacterium]
MSHEDRRDGRRATADRAHAKTPDGRYFIVAGRLWRSTNPGLPEAERQSLVDELMDARRAVKNAKAGKGDLVAARAAVDAAKVALGERGPVWWHDGAPDFNRHLAKNTPYADWASALKP